MKKWETPEVSGLGLANTKEDSMTNENAKIFFKCEYCGEKFWTFWDRDCHEKICEKNPNFDIEDDMTTDHPVPAS